MKKFFTLLVALTTIFCGLNAEVLLKDSFNYEVGDLTKTDMIPGPVTNAEWFYTNTTAAKIQVIDTALTFNGYCSKPSAKAMQFKGNTNKAIRAIKAVTEKSVYYSMILRVQEIKSSATKDGIIMLQNNSSISPGYSWAQLRYLNDNTAGKFQLGITKTNENGIRWISLPKDSTMLIVVRYDFIAGEKNDECYLWVNPTKTSEGTPTSWCVQDTANDAKTTQWGANQKEDASSLDRFMLKPAAHTPNIIIDELRVATKWTDLFETGGGDEPELGVSPASIAANYIFQGDEKTYTINVTGQKLAGDVTISNKNTEISLSTAKITKAAAEAGASFTATIKANNVGDQTDTITLTSDTITKKIPVAWSTIGVANCANVKALKDSVNGQDGWSKYVRLTGEAIVTRDTTQTSLARELYIEDATGAAKITDDYSTLDATNLVGAKIKDFVFLNGEAVLGVQPFIAQGKPTVVSTGNEVEPQVVTLAELQANATNYLLELVQVQKVTFADGGSTFSAKSWEISQDSKTANVKVEMGNGITGNEIPAKANVTGFSLNTSGSVIVPRGIADIVDASEVLLKNGSFEKYKTSSSPFGSATTFDDWDLSGILGTALAVETTDVLEGQAAFKTTKDVTAGNLYQEINCENYATGDQFDIRICYKNLDTKDSAIVLNSYWASSMGATEPLVQPEELKQALPNSQVWDTITIRATKPEQAKYFVMKFNFAKKAQVLLDNLDFKYYEDTVPYFSVMPEKETYSFTANINSDTTLVTLTIRQRNLKQPVKLELLGTGKAAYSIDKTQVTAAEETVTIKFKTSTTGKFNATLNITDDESTETSLMNKSIWFYGTAIDPSKTPELIVTPLEFDTFRCKALEEVTDTIFVTSSNCSDYVRCWANEQTGEPWAFGISKSYLSANATDTIILTFAPKKAGNYTAKIKVFTTGTDTIFINVAGVAEEGKPEPTVVDWDTTFTWNMAKPYAILNEQFNHADTCYNKTLKTTDWQNVVLTGQRPWWGYESDTTKQAKITSYYSYETPGTKPMENWLVTPALDYKNATKQIFTFKVMGEFMQSEQTAKLEVYYIDATDSKDIWFQHLESIDSLIPANDENLNGQWNEVYISLAGQELIPDVFFMAFKFTDNGGTNGIVYYVDDVTWGVKDVPTGINEVQNSEFRIQNSKFIQNGQLYIVKDGKRYNILGLQQ